MKASYGSHKIQVCSVDNSSKDDPTVWILRRRHFILKQQSIYLNIESNNITAINLFKYKFK